MRAQAFFSSLSFESMKSRTSGWSAFRMTIFAARRVLPPLLTTPAKASKPFMKLTGPLAMPPPDADVEPDRAVERHLLVQEQVRQLRLERGEVLAGREVALRGAPTRDGV